MAFGVRHQSACATRQSAASCNATVSEAGNSGHEPGERRSRSGVAGRSVGGGDCADPLFHPKKRRGLQKSVTGKLHAVHYSDLDMVGGNAVVENRPASCINFYSSTRSGAESFLDLRHPRVEASCRRHQPVSCADLHRCLVVLSAIHFFHTDAVAMDVIGLVPPHIPRVLQSLLSRLSYHSIRALREISPQ